jgi:hypothetical protein
MSDDSIVHRAIAIGAIALAACLGGTVFGTPPVIETTAPVPTAATVLSDEKRWQVASPAITAYEAKEPPAGPVPTVNYDVRIGGQNFSHAVAVPVPIHIANAVYTGQKLPSADSAEPQITISYQAMKDAPRFLMTASISDMQARIGGWINQPLDLAALGVTSIEITPTNIPVIKPTAPDPTPEQKGNESHGDALKTATEVLGAIAAVLSIADVLAKQVKERRASRHHENPSPAIRQYRLEGSSVVLWTENGITQTVITKEDIVESDDNDRQLILTWAASITNLFHRWTAIYPEREASVDPVVNEQVDAELDKLQNSICTDLKKLRRFIERTGNRLAGFEAIEAVCQG